MRTAIIREAAVQDPNMKTGRSVVASVFCEICLKLSQWVFCLAGIHTKCYVLAYNLQSFIFVCEIMNKVNLTHWTHHILTYKK